MKLIVDIRVFRSAAHGTGASERHAVFIRGYDSAGRWIKAAMCDGTAERLNAAVTALTSEGKEVPDLDLYIELFGAWRNGPVLKREDGSPMLDEAGAPLHEQHFICEDWNLLQGASLDLARLKRWSSRALDEAKAMHDTGNLQQAYNLLSAFLNRAFPKDSEDAALEEGLRQEDVALSILEARAGQSTAAKVDAVASAEPPQPAPAAPVKKPFAGFGVSPTQAKAEPRAPQHPFDGPHTPAEPERETAPVARTNASPAPGAFAKPGFGGFGKPPRVAS